MNQRRIIGSRKNRTPGILRSPTEYERAWVASMSRRPTRVPKGVYRYASIQEANADWERWHAEMVTENIGIQSC